jgi:hypothetical protein
VLWPVALVLVHIVNDTCYLLVSLVVVVVVVVVVGTLLRCHDINLVIIATVVVVIAIIDCGCCLISFSIGYCGVGRVPITHCVASLSLSLDRSIAD